MKIKILIPALCLCLLLLAAPAAADNSTESPLEYHPFGLTLTEIRHTISAIIQDNTLSPSEKLNAQIIAMGMDERLIAWMNAERDEVTGEPIYPSNVPIVSNVLDFLGITSMTPENPYNQEEGQKAYDEYMNTYALLYKPTGSFGGPVE